MTGAGPGCIGFRIKAKRFFAIGITYASLMFIVRRLYLINNIPLGTHAYILFASFAILLILVGKLKVIESILATIINIFMIYLGEGMLLIPILNFLGLDPLTLTAKPLNLLIAGTITSIPLMILFLVSYTFKFSIINFNKFKELN